MALSLAASPLDRALPGRSTGPRRGWRCAWLRSLTLVAATGLAACSGPPVADLAALNGSYAAALDRTAAQAADFPPGSPAERAALDRVQDYFRSVTPASVATATATTYAPDAYLNDTVAAVSGAPAIERYFAGSARRTRSFGVEFLDTARSGTDYYVRWKMTVVADGLNGGAPVLTYGVTQFRFDAGGRVLIHKDFWDAGTGLYEQLPGIGGIIRRIRGAAHDS
jgi:hypothetical protein